MQPYKRPKSARWTFLTGLESNPAYEAKLRAMPVSAKRSVTVERVRDGKRTIVDPVIVERRQR